MKAVILAGGYGTRFTEETYLKPKPMIEIGGKPILWHIMKIYSSHGVNNFVICCGYKGQIIKEYFKNYFYYNSDITIDTHSKFIEIHEKNKDPWRVPLVDTGENTMTGGRLKLVKKYLKGEKSFCFTYGDGLSDVNITELIKFHKKHKKMATLTAVQPPGRYGVLKLGEKNVVNSFKEKPYGEGSWINGGFFVLQTQVLEKIKDKDSVWEKEPLEGLAKDNQLYAFKHEGFWQPMDTLRDKKLLEELWLSGKAPWKIWP